MDRTIKEEEEYLKMIGKKLYPCEQGVVAHTSNLSSWEAEAGKFRVWGQPELYSLPCLQEGRKEGSQKGGQREERKDIVTTKECRGVVFPQ